MISLTRCALLLVLTAGCATTHVTPATPEEVVGRFCQLDLEGARLSSDTWPRVVPLVTWERQPDTDPVYLVSGYEVGAGRIEGERAEVPVRYEVIDRIGVPWKEAEGDLESSSTVTFELVRERGVWKIAGPAITPRTSPESLARVIRTWPQTGFGGNTDSRLQDTLRYLDSLSGE